MIRKWALGAFLLGWLAGCGTDGSGSGGSAVQTILQKYPELEGKPYTAAAVKRIVDGDTFEIDTGQKVRLIGVNTPEITNGKNEVYGAEAKAFTEERLLNKQVYLFEDAGATDKYGRLLRYAFAEADPAMFNETLVAEGYANTMTVPPNVLFAETFAALERAARLAGRGLWAEDEQRAAAAKQKDQNDQKNQKNEQNEKNEQNAPAPSASCSEPSIKGNINSKNERIYHMPGGKYYEQTDAEALFCNEDEAEKAGFRRAKQ